VEQHEALIGEQEQGVDRSRDNSTVTDMMRFPSKARMHHRHILLFTVPSSHPTAIKWFGIDIGAECIVPPRTTTCLHMRE
jgi:hypothetical protein